MLEQSGVNKGLDRSLDRSTVNILFDAGVGERVAKISMECR